MAEEQKHPPTSTQHEDPAYRRFVWQNISNGLVWLGAIVGLYVLALYFLPDEWNAYLKAYTDRPGWMFTIFFLSEAFTGLIPLELFIIWAASQPLGMYITYVVLLAVLSYVGGIVAFLLGTRLQHIRMLRRLNRREAFQRYGKLYRRWGGVVIIIAALTPLPYAVISFLSATFQFPFSRYLQFAAFRFLRFAFLGWLLWTIKPG